MAATFLHLTGLRYGIATTMKHKLKAKLVILSYIIVWFSVEVEYGLTDYVKLPMAYRNR